MRKNKNIYLGYLFILIFTACKPMSTNEPSESICQIESKILTNGDRNAYQDLLISYLDYKYPFESIYYSTIMGYKFKDKVAFFEIYSEIMQLQESKYNNETSDLTNIAIDQIKHGVSLGDYQACYHYGKLLIEGIYVKRDTLQGAKYIKYGEKMYEKK